MTSLRKDIAAPQAKIVPPERIRPTLIDHLRYAEEGGRDELADPSNGRIVAELEGGHEVDAGPIDRIQEVVALLEGHRNRLLHQNVFSGLRGSDAEPGMTVIVRADVDAVNSIVAEESLRVGTDIGAGGILEKLSRTQFVTIAQGTDCGCADLRYAAGMGLAHFAAPYNTNRCRRRHSLGR
jgi:hypothetical protein